MARITKFELEQLLAAANAEVLALRTRVSQLTADVALRDARIERGHALVREMQARSSVAPSIVEPIVTRFTRGGQVWEKTRIGNRSTERVVTDLDDGGDSKYFVDSFGARKYFDDEPEDARDYYSDDGHN